MQLLYWIIAVLLSAGAAYLVYITDKKREVPQPWLTALLRGLVIFFTLLLIIVHSITITKNTVEKPVVVVLQDNSKSIAGALGADSAVFHKNVDELARKLSGDFKVVEWAFGAGVQTDSLFAYNQPTTDISQAINRVQEFYGMQNLGAVILATDGKYNQGENPQYMQAGLHSSLYTVAIGDSAQQKDLRIAQTYVNKVVSLNSDFEIRADIVATLCHGYANTVALKEGNELVGGMPLAINSDRFDHAVAFTLKATKPGLHHYTLSVPPVEGEKNVTNNRKEIFVEVVDEKKNILIAYASPHPDINALGEAIKGLDNYQVTICTADNIPDNLANYNVIILHGLPSLRNDLSAKILAARKPVWFILTPQTNIAAMNNLRSLTSVSITPSGPRDVLAAYNNSFKSFTLPKQIQTVTDKMPPLSLTVANIVAPPGTNSLFTQNTGVQNSQSPVWLMEQGTVPVAFLAGEGIWRWRVYEFKNFNSHEVIDECIRQTVSFLSANTHEKPFTVGMPKYVWRDQEPISLKAYLLNASNEQINTPDAKLTVTDSSGKKHEFTLERTGNNYSLNIGIWAGGTYTFTAKTNYNNKDYFASGSFAVESIPAELMEQGADYSLLYQLSKKYNGCFVTAPNIGRLYDSIKSNNKIKPLIQTTTEAVPFVDSKWFFFIILILAVAEWLLRKYWMAQ